MQLLNERMDSLSPYGALAQAIDQIGGQGAMARLCGITQPAVWKWTKTRKALPAEYVLKVEEKTGISRHDLRPDLYPRDHQPSPSSSSSPPQTPPVSHPLAPETTDGVRDGGVRDGGVRVDAVATGRQHMLGDTQ